MRLLASLLFAVGLILAAAPARAEITADAAAKLASGDYDKIIVGIELVANSGDPRAIAIIQALSDGKLLAGRGDTLTIEESDGTLSDAVTGAALDAKPAEAKAIRLNNKVRRSLAAMLGRLNLIDADPARRRAAAEAVFKSRDKDSLAAIDAALAKEQDSGVRLSLAAAHAAIILTDSTTGDADKVAAVAVIAERGGQDAKGLLASLSDLSPQVQAAVTDAIGIIDTNLLAWSAVQAVYYGISLGSVLLLAAIGLAITFGVMGVINMAHGEMVMLGAYTTFVVQEVIRQNIPGLFDYSLIFAVPLAFLVAGAVGMAIERTMIRFLYGRPLETLLMTFGLSLMLQQAIRTLFGASNREVGNPSWMSGSFDLGGLSLTYSRLYIILFAIAVFVALMLVLKRTALGLQMRAVTQNRRMAASMGIRTNWVDSFTFGIGSGVAGIAGVALSQIDNVSPNLGQGYIIDSFMVVVFGGVGNLWGTLVGALSLGIVNKLLEPFAGAVLGKIIVLVVLVLFIQRRPRGLFPIKGRFVDS